MGFTDDLGIDFKVAGGWGPLILEPRAVISSCYETPRPVGICRTRKKGYKLPQNTVSVCRPFVWGNLFRTAEAYARWLETNRIDLDQLLPKYRDEWYRDNLIGRRNEILKRLPELAGKNLACFCKLPEQGQPDMCHRAVLLRLANPT